MAGRSAARLTHQNTQCTKNRFLTSVAFLFLFFFSFKRCFSVFPISLNARPVERLRFSDLLSRNNFKLNYWCKAVLGCGHYLRYTSYTGENGRKYYFFARHERLIQTLVGRSEKIVNFVEYTPSERMVNVQQTEYCF